MALLPNEIFIGSLTEPQYYFKNHNLMLGGAKGSFNLDILGNELSIDQFTFEIRYDENAPMAYSPTNADVYLDTNNKIYLVIPTGRIPQSKYLTDVEYATPVWWFVNSNRIAKGYVKSIERKARYVWQVTCMSGIGLLEDKMHVGGIYNGVLCRNVLSEIVNGAFEYGITTEVGNTRIYGWLPYDTARNNLHRLLFAVGASMRQGVNVDYNVVYLSPNTVSVPSSRIALGGSVQMQSPATGAEITEHGFSALASDTVVSLYDNTQGDVGAADNLTVTFSEPMHDLTTTGTLTVNESGANYAVVSGTGTLSGKRYTHSKSIVAVGDTTSDKRNVKRVEDNCLVSTANSWNVAQRVLSYFQSAKTVKAKILLNAEKPGQNISMTDAYGEDVNAYLSKMDVVVTTVRGANCELIEGYTPDYNGNNFTNRLLVDADGTWTVPAGVTMIRIVLIGGGNGGTGGYDGKRGMGGLADYFFPNFDVQFYWVINEDYLETAYWLHGNSSVPGGDAGNPGASGNVYVATVTVEPGEVLTFTVGSGGVGGAKNGGVGTVGLPTSVTSSAGWTLTSADGVPSEIGYHDVIGNITVALPGEVGHQGGAGGITDTTDNINHLRANLGGDGYQGGSVGQWRGGKGGKGLIDNLLQYHPRPEYPNQVSAGGGGGAAWGANGGDAGNAEKYNSAGYGSYRSGKPGNGANAVAPTKPTYGCGGGGGNGGGSGGNCAGFTCNLSQGQGGGIIEDNKIGWGDDVIPQGGGSNYGGKPGNGSAGGDGGDGCGLIYF